MKKLFFWLFILQGCHSPDPDIISVLDNICSKQSNSILQKDPTKTYTILATDNELDITDSAILDIGLYCLGYIPQVVNSAVTKEELSYWLEQPSYLFFFSGHGKSGLLTANDGSIWLRQHPLKSHFVILEACYTLENPTLISSFITPEVEYIMGYTEKSWDKDDNDITYSFLQNLQQGLSIPDAFYHSTISNSKFTNAWVIYKQTSEGLIEYSARSNNLYIE